MLDALSLCDLVFYATPNKIAMTEARALIVRGVRGSIRCSIGSVMWRFGRLHMEPTQRLTYLKRQSTVFLKR